MTAIAIRFMHVGDLADAVAAEQAAHQYHDEDFDQPAVRPWAWEATDFTAAIGQQKNRDTCTYESRSLVAGLVMCGSEQKDTITYRVVVGTQYYENYGAHDWDGVGECPQYWKAKGGSDFIVAEGLSEFDMLTREASEFVPEGIEHRSEYSETQIRCVAFLPSNVKTYEEQMIHDFERWGQPLRPAEVESMMREVRRYMKEIGEGQGQKPWP